VDPDPDSIRCDVPDSTALKTEKLKKEEIWGLAV
jgi:hypothetical protein